MEQKAFLELLQTAVKSNASDIHLGTGSSPAFRIKGDVRPVTMAPLTDQEMVQILSWMVSEKAVREKITEIKDYDGSFDIKNLCRFRYNIHKHRGGYGAILRIIPFKIPTVSQLMLPKVLTKIAEMPRGLILVTGATGSGKSSTLATMIDHINTNSHCHILTVEDPIEFVHPVKKSRVTQREIGSHTTSFAGALRSALRQDPDVILVGEMRDPETIEIALKAAETGHLVFSTVHTTDAIKTIGRLIAVFPPDEQKMVRIRLADNLMPTISQRLVPKADKSGLIAVQEIMVSNAGIQDCISNPELTGGMNEFIAKSKDAAGGQTFEQHLVELYFGKIISLADAKAASSNPQDFERNLMYGASQGKESNPNKGSLSGIQGIEIDRGEPEEQS